MIFPEVNLDEWLKKYPALEVEKERCANCGASVEINKPFIMKDWVGIAAICKCGFHAGNQIISRTKNSEKLLSELFSYASIENEGEE